MVNEDHPHTQVRQLVVNEDQHVDAHQGQLLDFLAFSESENKNINNDSSFKNNGAEKK